MRTKDIEIIRTIGSIIDNVDVGDSVNNSLRIAIQTGDIHVIEEILLMGARPFCGATYNTIRVMDEMITNGKIFDLLMCIGVQIPSLIFNYRASEGLDSFCSYIGLCKSDSLIPCVDYVHKMYLYFSNRSRLSLSDCNEIETMLTNGRNQLINKAVQRQGENKKLLELVVGSMPVCCIDLIHGYYCGNKLCIN